MIKNQLFCPASKSALTLADESLLNVINAWLENTEILYQNGDSIAKPVHALLVDKQQNIAYPVNSGIPQLLAQYAISLEGLNIGNPATE